MSQGQSQGQIGVLLVGLGTPQAPTPKAVKTYLRQFLTDRRIVSANPVFWRALLEGWILPRRAPKSAARYARIWTDQGSPLLVNCQSMAAGVAQFLPGNYQVELAMRYGQPSLQHRLQSWRQTGINRVLLVPLHPQYSTTTNGSVVDQVALDALKSSNQLEVHWLHSYPTLPGYIEAMAQLVEQHWAQAGRPDFAAGQRLVMSFHSIPVSLTQAGDPYQAQCLQTAAALRHRLGLDQVSAPIAYQSRFGKARWLEPSTHSLLTSLGSQGVSRVDVICPAFTADCLETLEELVITEQRAFLEARTNAGHSPLPWVQGNDAGPETDADTCSCVEQALGLHLVPCVNNHPVWLEALAELIQRHTANW